MNSLRIYKVVGRLGKGHAVIHHFKHRESAEAQRKAMGGGTITDVIVTRASPYHLRAVAGFPDATENVNENITVVAVEPPLAPMKNSAVKQEQVLRKDNFMGLGYSFWRQNGKNTGLTGKALTQYVEKRIKEQNMALAGLLAQGWKQRKNGVLVPPVPALQQNVEKKMEEKTKALASLLAQGWKQGENGTLVPQEKERRKPRRRHTIKDQEEREPSDFTTYPGRRRFPGSFESSPCR